MQDDLRRAKVGEKLDGIGSSTEQLTWGLAALLVLTMLSLGLRLW